MSGEIDRLIRRVTAHLPFTAEKYSLLGTVSDTERLSFAIKHSALHFSKTAGKIASVAEDVDHDGTLDAEEPKKQTPKAMINTLRLAELLGMNEKEIMDAVEKECVD